MNNIYYHASPLNNLDKYGIDPKASPHVSRDTQNFMYLGSLDYIKNHYLDYAKNGTYYIYKVDITNIPIDNTRLPNDQIRTNSFIKPNSIILVEVLENEPIKHPREDEYREWVEEKQRKSFNLAKHPKHS